MSLALGVLYTTVNLRTRKALPPYTLSALATYGTLGRPTVGEGECRVNLVCGFCGAGGVLGVL